MDEGMRTRILDQARWAPNIDNSQPFYFAWRGEGLEIQRDAARDRVRGNSGHYASLVGLGCLIEYIRIAAGGEGPDARYEVPENPAGKSGPWARVTFRAGGSNDQLRAGLRQRASDRRLYKGGSLQDPVLQDVEADLQGIESCELLFLEEPGPDLLQYLKGAMAIMWQDKQMLPEVLKWIRWSDVEAARTKDGMPWRSLAISYPISRLMLLVSRSSLFRRLARRSGGPQRQQEQQLERQIGTSAALGCFVITRPDPAALVQVGRGFVRAWLRFNLAGYGVQVLASPALHALQHETGVLPSDLPEPVMRLFSSGKEVICRAFHAPQDRLPAWMFRVGRSTPLPERMRTYRRPLADWLR